MMEEASRPVLPRMGIPCAAFASLLLAAGWAGCLTAGTAPYDGEVVAYRAAFTEVAALEPIVDLSAPPETSTLDDLGLDLDLVQSLPNDLLIPPGNYTFEGRVYEMEDEGLYRFLAPEQRTEQRVVWDGDVATLLSAVAWIYTHGHEDDGKDVETINDKATREKIRATCGAISTWIGSLLGEVDVESRVVTTLTLEEWNEYNNGHTMIEVWHEEDDAWVVYDLDNNVYFTRDGAPLSFLGFVEAVNESDYEWVTVASDTRLSVPFKGGSGFDYTFYGEYTRGEPEKREEWYARVIQVPLIERDGDYWFYDEENRERIEGYSARYKYAPEDEWMSWFYP